MTCCCLWCCCCWLHCFYCCLPVTGAKKHNTEWLPTLPTEVNPQPSGDGSTKTGNTLRNPPTETHIRDLQGEWVHQRLSMLENYVFKAAIHNKSLYPNHKPNFWRPKIRIWVVFNDQSWSLHAVKGPDIYSGFAEENKCARGRFCFFYLLNRWNR